MDFAFIKVPQKNEINFIEGNLVSIDKSEISSTDLNGFVCAPWGEERKIFCIQGEFTEININELEFSIGNYFNDLNEFKFSSTSFDEFSNEVMEIQSAIKLGKVQKAVAARTVFVTQSLKINELINHFSMLISAYPNAMVTLFYSEKFGIWMGASPEILLLSENDDVTIMSLAGTLTNEHQNWSDKERLEQSITSEFISGVIKSFGIDENAYQGIQELTIGGLKHLRSDFKFKMKQPDQWNLLLELNPTPAVCGFPQKNAMELIGELEHFDRKLFTGYWGAKMKHSSNLYVNLRCCQLFSNGIQYFAGCGINLGSEVEKEWNETEAKMGMIKKFLS